MRDEHDVIRAEIVADDAHDGGDIGFGCCFCRLVERGHRLDLLVIEGEAGGF